MATTILDLARQAGVEFVPGRNYFKPEYRNCHSMELFCVALQAHLDADNDKEIEFANIVSKLERDKASAAKENSTLAAKLQVAIEEKAKAEKLTIRRGLESVPEISEMARNRIMDCSGSNGH